MADEAQWFYVADGKRNGPAGEAALRDLLRQGRVTANTLVWCDGMLDWKPLRQTPLAEAAVAAETPWIPDGTGGPGAPMGPVEAIISCLNKYFQFSGRASRSEYWYYQLFVLLCFGLFFAFLAAIESPHPLVSLAVILVFLAAVIPQWTAAVRRLHDTDRSGWWLLIQVVPWIGPVVLLVLLCLRPTPGRNRFG